MHNIQITSVKMRYAHLKFKLIKKLRPWAADALIHIEALIVHNIIIHTVYCFAVLPGCSQRG